MDKISIEEKLKSFKCLILDGDGVWFSGEEYRAVLPDGKVVVMKSRHYHDGQGLTFLRSIGIKILFATAEGEPMLSVVEKLNNLPGVLNGTFEKIAVLANLQKNISKVESIEKQLAQEGLNWEDCVYIGDDRTDLESMKKADLAVTPCDGQRLIKKIAHLVLSKDGGRGAIREFSEMVLDARGIDESTLPSA
jgi:3-deoxy-D-manno-octulosonate 8-phosphate phosphatase (KDO 8-P phosphatase)